MVVLQTHCDLKASVPVPTTIQEGGRGPTAGMLGQKVTTWAQEHKGGGLDRWWEVRAWVRCVRREGGGGNKKVHSSNVMCVKV